MKLGVLFSGGKDSTYAAYLAKKAGNELTCLITIFSENIDSYMFHTQKIELTKKQAKLMNLPIITKSTKGIKEEELNDLESAVKLAINKYQIQGITTGALHSQYQASRIQAICDKLKIKCINPSWHKDEISYLNELINSKFKVVVTKTAAEGLDNKWIRREIDKNFIEDIKVLNKKWGIHPAGEGGEYETLVLNCPLFKEELKVRIK